MKNFTRLAALALTSLAATAAQATPATIIARDQAPITVTDQASSTVTATQTSAAYQAGSGSAYSVQLNIASVSGTTPTLDVEVQESDDQGTNWYPVYDFHRITAAGVHRSPILPLTGGKIRYVETVGGSSPSYTFTIKRQQENWAGARLIRQLVDRTVALTTASSTTASLYAEGAMNVELSVSIGAAGTVPALQLQGSDDGQITWFNIGSPLSGVASSTVAAFNANVAARHLRALVSTAGATVTPNYVLIKAY